MKTFKEILEARIALYNSVYEKAGMPKLDVTKIKQPRAELVDGTLKMEIDGPIDEFMGVDLRPLTNELEENPDAPVELRISSPGGDFFMATAFYGRLREREANVTTIASGLAASAGSILLLAGDDRQINEGTVVMTHAVQGGLFAMGDRSDIAQAAAEIDAVLETLDNTVLEIYQNRLDISDERAQGLIEGDNWLTTSEALELGFATVENRGKKVKDEATNEVVLTDDEYKMFVNELRLKYLV